MWRRKCENKAKLANKVRRVDRRTNALQTDRPTDQPTDTASYRGALSHLKRGMKIGRFGVLVVLENGKLKNMDGNWLENG